jgi:hypothetical protein
MRTLQLHFPDNALATLHTVLKQTKDARVFRRAQAVHELVKGTRLHTGSDTRAFPSSTLSTWAHHFTQAGAPGLVGRPRSGRPPTVTCALDMQLNRLVEQEPLPHGFLILSGVTAHSPRRWQLMARRGRGEEMYSTFHAAPSAAPPAPARRRGLQPGGTRGRTVWTARGGASHAA